MAIFCASEARAVKPVFDLNLFYLTDSLGYDGTESQYQRTFYDVMAGFPLTKKRRLILGWNYASLTYSDNPGTETSLKITDMGPKLLYYLNKDRTWVVGMIYNLITKADYTAADTTELRGSSMRFEFGYTPMMWENVFIGAKLVYYKASFVEEITNQTNLAQVTHSRTTIYPSFTMTFRWE